MQNLSLGAISMSGLRVLLPPFKDKSLEFLKVGVTALVDVHFLICVACCSARFGSLRILCLITMLPKVFGYHSSGFLS